MVEDMVNRSVETNAMVLNKLKESEHSTDLFDQTWDDYEQGWMSKPELLTDDHMHSAILSRRLALREYRPKGWRTRCVDHHTESLLKETVWSKRKLQQDNIDRLWWILWVFYTHGIRCVMSKGDISSAYRRLPIRWQEVFMAAVVFLHAGQAWVSYHRTLSFGATGSCFGWHMVSKLIMIFLRRRLFLPALKYVDDYFGLSRMDVKYDLGYCLGVVAMALGTPTEEAKTERFNEQMVILGMQVTLFWIKRMMTVGLLEDKKKRWVEVITECLEEGGMSSADATKMAGRLQWATSALMSRVGRAQLKPIYAQANRPLPSGRISPWLARSLRWWLLFLDWMPQIPRPVIKKQQNHIVTWADASGEGRKIAAVAWNAETDEMQHTWMVVPQELLQAFLPRNDHEIQAQELLGVLLAFATFSHLITNNYWTVYCDNQAVLNQVLNGCAGASAGDLNAICGHLWLDIVKANAALNIVRVESKANIADGPTRDRFQLLEELGSLLVTPVLPTWLANFWLPFH